MSFNKIYLLPTVLLFAIEVCIARFFNDQIIRPFVGDVLVVGLIYCFLRIFLNFEYRKTAFGVLLFACTIEILQYFNYVELLGFKNNRIMRIILGTTFAWEDFIAYLTGFLLIVIVEEALRRTRKQTNL